jgi:hypothetical protein
MSAVKNTPGPLSFSAGARCLEEQLKNSPYWSLRRLTCAIAGERVVLRGRVPCFYLKQVAQALAVRTVGVGQLQSDIEVHTE